MLFFTRGDPQAVLGGTGDSDTRQPRRTAQTWGPSSWEGIQASCSVVTRVWGTGGLQRVKRRAEIRGLQAVVLSCNSHTRCKRKTGNEELDGGHRPKGQAHPLAWCVSPGPNHSVWDVCAERLAPVVSTWSRAAPVPEAQALPSGPNDLVGATDILKGNVTNGCRGHVWSPQSSAQCLPHGSPCWVSSR